MNGQFKSLSVFQIFIAVILGVLTGSVLGPHSIILGELGSLLIKLLKALASPLIFFAIIDAFCKTEIKIQRGVQLFLISTLNAMVAGGIALVVSQLFAFISVSQFSSLQSFSDAQLSKSPIQEYHFNFLKSFKEIIPESLFEPFIKNHVLSVVFLAVLFGLGMKRLKRESVHGKEVELLETFWSGGLKITTEVLRWIVRGIPLAVFGVIAKTVAVSGISFLATLGTFVGVIFLGIAIHCLIYYSALLWIVARVSPREFFQKAAEALMTAFGTGSSLATLPVTLKTLQSKMKISEESSRLGACVGTNLNHDGILLYEAMAAVFVAHLSGIQLGMGQKALLIAVSTLAAVGSAGIPEAGFITLSLVLSAVGLPLTWVPLLLTVDWFIGRLRAVANVTSDMVVATILESRKNQST